MYHSFDNQVKELATNQIIAEVGLSRSQWYRWLSGVEERKKREPKVIAQDVAEKAVSLIMRYPHLSGPKGQQYMIYHRWGYIPQHAYKKLKKIVGKLIFQAVSAQKLLPARTSYTHERPDQPGRIWAEDFTQLRVAGTLFYVSLLIDVFSTLYLGFEVSSKADRELVECPLLQALENNQGRGPKRFLLSDNGTQYISEEHGKLLDRLDIIQKRIPACRPEYNGSVECGVKEFKKVFYNVWSEWEKKMADKEKRLDELVREAVSETITRLNHEIPRPCLGGVTPSDVHQGIDEHKRQENQQYCTQELQRKEVEPWSQTPWQLVKNAIRDKNPGNFELMTKFCFFLKRPLRKLPYLQTELLGNL